jgi:hypothetical protein
LTARAGDLVEVEELRLGAAPEDGQIGLVPDLEGPVVAHLLEPVAVHEVPHEVVHERLPALPALGRRDARAVGEDRLGRVAGQVARHERQLHDRPQVQAEESVVHGVHAAEVVHRPSVDLAVDGQLVEEDPVRAHRADAELPTGDGEGLRELGADRPTAGADPAQEQREVLRADDRPPRSLQRTEHLARRHADLDRAWPAASGVPNTAGESGGGRASAAAIAPTAYHAGRPRSPVVSAYAVSGTAMTSRPPWSTGANGPSGL